MKSWLLAKRSRWITALVLVVLAVVAIKTHDSLPEVTTATAETGSLTLPIAASGKVDGIASDLGFGISGRISDIYVNEGQEITVEQTLARVEPVGGFMDGGPGSDVIQAPYDGWVVAIYHRQGACTAQGVPVLRVVKRGKPWVTAFIDAEDAAYLNRGDSFTCRAGGYLARPWRLEATEIGREAIPREDVPGSARQVRVRMRPVDLDFSLAVGTPVDIDGEVDLVDKALLVPAAAIVRENGSSFVWVVAGGQVSRREVIAGANNFRQIVIAEGLAAGDQVVVEHKTDLKDGALVRATPWDVPSS